MFGTDAPRVAIVQTQQVFAKALSDIFRDSGQMSVAAVSSTLPADAFENVAPDVVIIDVDDATIDLRAHIARCRAALPDVKICVLSSHLRPEVMQRCMDASADGYVVKDVSPEEFIRAIRIVAGGMTYVDARVAGSVVRLRASHEPGARRSDVAELSEREIDVLRLIAEGLSNRDISGRLHLSEKTVKNHVSRILSKIHTTSRTHAAVHAIRSGIG